MATSPTNAATPSDGDKIGSPDDGIQVHMRDLKAYVQTQVSRIVTLEAQLAAAGTLPSVGDIKLFSGTSAPAGWQTCDGSAISRTTYAALFTLIGTLYGAGNGTTTFNVPDFRGRVALGSGQGSGLSNYALAATGGEEKHALISAENGPHTHGYLPATNNTTTGGGGFPASSQVAVAQTDSSGSGTPHENRQPYLAVSFLIKL